MRIRLAPRTERLICMDYQAIACAVRAAGEHMLKAKLTPEGIHRKPGKANFVTDFDFENQRYLFGELRKIVPGATFFGEEDTEGNQQNRLGEDTFIIDPIDGTTNFMFGYNYSCVSVGYAHKGQLQAGWVYNPYLDEMYSAVKGQGSFCNGHALEIEDRPLSEGVTGFGCAGSRAHLETLFDLLKVFAQRCLSLRDGGSAALDMCRVAAGGNVLYYERSLFPYDYAAATIIIEEAGGRVLRANGEPIRLDASGSIVAGTPAAVEEALAIIRTFPALAQ